MDPVASSVFHLSKRAANQPMEPELSPLNAILHRETVGENRQSSEIQGTALGKSLRARACIYRSMPAGVAQSRHAFVGGTVSTWAR